VAQTVLQEHFVAALFGAGAPWRRSKFKFYKSHAHLITSLINGDAKQSPAKAVREAMEDLVERDEVIEPVRLSHFRTRLYSFTRVSVPAFMEQSFLNLAPVLPCLVSCLWLSLSSFVVFAFPLPSKVIVVPSK
jgi:hypothetical protein